MSAAKRAAAEIHRITLVYRVSETEIMQRAGVLNPAYVYERWCTGAVRDMKLSTWFRLVDVMEEIRETGFQNIINDTETADLAALKLPLRRVRT